MFIHRCYTDDKQMSAGRTKVWSGIVRNEPGMVGNDFLEKLPGNCWGLLTKKTVIG